MTKHKKHSKKIKIAPITLVLGSSLLLIISYRFFAPAFRPQSTDINQVDNATGGVTLTLTPTSSNIKPGEDVTLTLTANAGDLKVTYTKVELTYDAAKLGTPVVTLGDFLTNSFADPIIGNGKIILEVAAPASSGGKTGSGTLATIKVKPTVVDNSTVSITANTTVSAIDTTGIAISGNSLKSATDAHIIATSIEESTPTPTPTPTQTPHSTLTPTSTPTPTPTPKPTNRPPTNVVPSQTPANYNTSTINNVETEVQTPERTFVPSSFGQNNSSFSQTDLGDTYPDTTVKKTFLERIFEFFRNIFGGQ